MNQFRLERGRQMPPVCQILCNSEVGVLDTHTHTHFHLICIAFQDGCLSLQFTDEEAEIQGPGRLCQVSQLVNVSAACREESYEWRVGRRCMSRG